MTTTSAPFGQMVTAMITPMTPDGAVDYDGAARLAEYLVTDMRNDALVLNGTNGEAPTTNDAEQERLLRVVLGPDRRARGLRNPRQAGPSPPDRRRQGRQGRPVRHLTRAGPDRPYLLLRHGPAQPALALPRRGRLRQRGRRRGGGPEA